jgi:group II intron reverse transcriptase/maturase
MNGRGQSDRFIVPQKSVNNAAEPAAERMEGRERAKGKSREQNASQTQSWMGAPSALERLREAAERDRKERFTALLHHIYDPKRLRVAYDETRRDAAAGVDGETWQHYGKRLEENLQDLSERLKRGGYRARPVRRVYIPKADGRQRPLGVPTLEDKIVQRAAVEVLNAIYERDFLGFSYGFRPERSQHDALDALATAIHREKVNWVLDADIRSFFDMLDQEWLRKFIEHRMGDQRVVHLIMKWLKAGVLEDGKRILSEKGTVQGGSISPLLANVYLHYVFDLWAEQWRRKRAHGAVIVVRYADDFIVGFEHREEAEQFLTELRERFARFGLELHPEKTRLLAFGRKPNEEWRKGRGAKPETFNFLGFTHSCGESQSGRFMVVRQTMRKRMSAKLGDIKQELRRRMHHPIREQGKYLRAVLQGYFRFHGVPLNSRAIRAFRQSVILLWRQTLRRRSQKSRLNWRRLMVHVNRWLPHALICHPYPLVRFDATTRGKSRMR